MPTFPCILEKQVDACSGILDQQAPASSGIPDQQAPAPFDPAPSGASRIPSKKPLPPGKWFVFCTDVPMQRCMDTRGLPTLALSRSG